MTVFESNNGKVEKIRDGHFKVTIFSELGYCSFEKRHTTLDYILYNHKELR